MWLTNGDQNTIYYHTKTIASRSKNRVNILQIVEGLWVKEKKKFYELIIDFYKNPFKEEKGDQSQIHVAYLYPKLNDNQKVYIDKRVTNEEINKKCYDVYKGYESTW